MKLPPYLVNRLENAEKVSELINVITDICEEYDFGILSEHERRIENLEKNPKHTSSKSR